MTNGMWKGLADQQDKFIGGTLLDLDKTFGNPAETEIVGMSFDGTTFDVKGKDYSCSMNREYAVLARYLDGVFEVSAVGLPGFGFLFRAAARPKMKEQRCQKQP